MSLLFFLALSENIYDHFAYGTLLGKEYKDIPTHRDLVTQVRYVVMIWDLKYSCMPRFIQKDEGLKFFNPGSTALFGEEKLSTDPGVHDSYEVAIVVEEEIALPPSPPVLTNLSEAMIF